MFVEPPRQAAACPACGLRARLANRLLDLGQAVKHSIAKPNSLPSKHTATRKDFLSGQQVYNSSLILIEFSCADVTELPSLKDARRC